MGVKHQLILGVILTWSLCVSYGTATEVNSTTVDNAIEGVSHRNVNLIEKLPKTEIEQKDVHTNNTQENSTTIKSNIISHETSTVVDTSSGAINSATKKENTIKKDSTENGREENARSIDIEKYVSPEFQNNVFTMPNFPDTEKYFDFKSSTEKPLSSFSDFDLTTPKSDFFDNKFKELSEELRQKLEQDFDDNQNDNDHDHDSDDGNEHEHEDLHDNDDNENDDDDEMHVDKTLEEPKIKRNATFNYKEMKNIIVKNNTDGKSHNDVIVEKVKKVNFVSNFNDTKIYDYDSKDDVDTSAKNETPTTRKPINLTKPPNNENNSDILNNKIETGTIKAIASSTTEFTATKRSIEDAQLGRESQLEKLVVAPFTTEQTENESGGTTKLLDIIMTTSKIEATTVNPETTTALEETTSVHSTTTDAKTEPFTTTIVMNNDRTTTEIADTTTTANDYSNETTTYETTESSHIVDETTKELTTTDTISTTTSTTTDFVETTTITEIPTTEIVTKAPELITTEDVATIIITTKRSQGLTPQVNASQDKTTSSTTIITRTTSKEETTEKTYMNVSSTNPTNKVETTVASIKMNANTITTTTITPTTAEMVFRNEFVTEEMTETPYGTETSIGTSGPIDDSGNASAVVIAISTIGAICLILLAGLLYIMRKRQKRFNYKQRCRPVSLDDYSVDNLSAYNNSVRRKGALMRQSKRSYGNPAFDDPSAPTHPLNFPALSKFAVNMDDIKLEFEDIPQITAKTNELPEGCEPKNRYANVIPLPETRVSLKPIDGYPNSDYINANFVTGPDKIKGFYIACQAPMQNTVDDFWRMIWEQQSKVILMITHFFENGVEKCVDYLPPSEVLDCHRLFGDFQVTLRKRDVKEKYIISSLQLKNMVSNSWREVTHFWYLGWPEKGIPSEANSLIAFLIEARSFMKTSTLDRNAVANGTSSLPRTEVNPVVVHCSPGTGRTGVVIACDIAIREFEQTRLVDIPKIVYMIRRDRANAVQTKEQYMFIYKVVNLYATKLAGGALESL